MNLATLKNTVNLIKQDAVRNSFQILIKMLEETGFAAALMDAELAVKMEAQFEKTMAAMPEDQPKVEQEDLDAQMEDGEEIPDADVVEQTEIETPEEPDVTEYPQDLQEDKELTTGDQTTDAEPTTGDAPEKMTITSDDVGEIDAATFELKD